MSSEIETTTMNLTSESSADSPIIYIMVIGFHHKLGCQLEFVYPNSGVIKKSSDTTGGDLYTLPKNWAHLPSLALPDGSHNYSSDYVYFHLEDDQDATNIKGVDSSGKKTMPNRTLFGISCFRQIDASEMINKDSNVTRNTLQKSVCILSTTPLYATSIRLKLHSITCAFFDQKDFRKTQILVDAFNTTFRYSTQSSDYSINYKKCTDDNLIGLSLGDLVVRYQHKILVLFKLLLLQKKCLFQLKPVANLSNTIIALISLLPDIFRPDNAARSGLEFCSGFFDSIELVNSELGRKGKIINRPLQSTSTNTSGKIKKSEPGKSKSGKKKKRILSFSNGSIDGNSASRNTKSMVDVSGKLDSSVVNEEAVESPVTSTPSKKNGNDKHHRINTSPGDLINETPPHSNTTSKLQLEDFLQIDFGMPYNLFSHFNILHPYLSLYYLDYFAMINKMNTKLYCTTSLMLSMMSQANAVQTSETTQNTDTQNSNDSGTSSTASTPYRPNQQKKPLNIGYTIGATNVLFKQRLYDELDAFVDETNIDLKQNEILKKQLQLTTADLRFSDYLIKNVNANRSSLQQQRTNSPTLLSVKKMNQSGTGGGIEMDDSMNNSSMLSSSNWEGSDEWIRLNFKWYFYSLLGSLVKEEIFGELKNEAETLIGQIAEMEQQNVGVQLGSSSSSATSLANEVVDIDDYIERASINKSSMRLSKRNKNISKPTSSYSLNPSNTNGSTSSHSSAGSDKQPISQASKSSRKNSINHSLHSLSLTGTSTTLTLAQDYLNSTDTNHVTYADDYNTSYLAEFKQTECFLDWIDANRQRLEVSLFKMNEMERIDGVENDVVVDRSEDTVCTDSNLIVLNSKLNLVIKKLRHLDSTRLSHPFSGTLGMNDIKLKFNFLFTTTESGKKINRALAEGTKMGKAVGDALSHAKTSFSSFLSSWTSSPSSGRQERAGGNGGDKQKFTNL